MPSCVVRLRNCTTIEKKDIQSKNKRTPALLNASFVAVSDGFPCHWNACTFVSVTPSYARVVPNKKGQACGASDGMPGEDTQKLRIVLLRGVEERPAFLLSITMLRGGSAATAAAGCREQPLFGRNWWCTLSSIAVVAFLLVFDVLCVKHAAIRASRGGARSLLDDLVPATVGVYYSSAHGRRGGGGDVGGGKLADCVVGELGALLGVAGLEGGNSRAAGMASKNRTTRGGQLLDWRGRGRGRGGVLGGIEED